MSRPLPPVPSPGLRARVLDAVGREPVPPRPAARWSRARPLVIGFGLLLAFLAKTGVHPGTRPIPQVAGLVIASLLVAGAATWAAVGRGRSMLGRPQTWLVAVLALTPIALMAVSGGLALVWPPAAALPEGQHFRCDIGTLIMSLGPLFAFGAYRRRSDPVSPRLSGAAIAMAAGSWAVVVHYLICPFSSPLHILLGHVAPAIGVALVGSVLMARAVAVRAKTG